MEESAKEETIGIRNVGEKNGFINDTNSNSSIQLETYGVVRDVGRTRFSYLSASRVFLKVFNLPVEQSNVPVGSGMTNWANSTFTAIGDPTSGTLFEAS